jgi:hypothetical protein
MESRTDQDPGKYTRMPDPKQDTLNQIHDPTCGTSEDSSGKDTRGVINSDWKHGSDEDTEEIEMALQFTSKLWFEGKFNSQRKIE